MKRHNKTAMTGWKHTRRGWWYYIKYDEASNTYAARIGRKIDIMTGRNNAYPYMMYVFETRKAARAMCLRVIGEQIWCYSHLNGELLWQKWIYFSRMSILIEPISGDCRRIFDIKFINSCSLTGYRERVQAERMRKSRPAPNKKHHE